MVATSQTLATAAGLLVLQKGGTAADAAVAAAAALNVTEPGSTGLGGDAFVLYYEAASGKVTALNGSGRAPAALSIERLQREGLGESLPIRHPYTVTVPGACAAWCDTVARFGRLSMEDVLSPAIRLAEEGFPVAPITANSWQRSANGVLKSSLNGQEMTIDGRGPKAGEIFKNPGLAFTLKQIAEYGRCGFYEGAVAEKVVLSVQEAGGCIALDDLAKHESTWEEPISTIYGDMRVWECPPNGQGLAALLALNILSGFDCSAYGRLSAQRLHLEIEAMRLAFADAHYYVADPTFFSIPISELLSEAYAAERRKLIHPAYVNQDLQHGFPIARSDTVYLSVVDEDGNACSFINSTYMDFGSGIVPYGLGFGLQNRGHNFSLDPEHPNALKAGKRSYHTIIPAMATREVDGSLFASFGVMGGFMQPQGHMQVVRAMIDDGLDPQSALDQPRFCVEGGNIEGIVGLEEGISDKVYCSLEEMGHRVRRVSGMERGLFGRGQIIQRDPHSGVLCGGSDPRADGCALSLW